MRNNFFILRLVLLLSFIFFTVAHAEENDAITDEVDPIEIAKEGSTDCDGNDPNSGVVLIPEEWVKRCKLCTKDGQLEFDRSCLQRIAYDQKYQQDQYQEQFDAAMETYIKDDLKAALKDFISIGQNTNRAKTQAGYGKNLGIEKITKIFAEEEGEETEVDTESLSDLLQTGLDEKKDISVDKCIEEQTGDSGRCYIEANNRVTSESTRILNRSLATISMLGRSQTIDNIMELIPVIEVSKSDKALILPSDDDVNEIDKSEKGKANE